MAFVESVATLENVKLEGKEEEPQTLASHKGPVRANLVWFSREHYGYVL